MTETKKATKRRKGQSASKAIVIRKDYIRRLIAGVRREIRQDKDTIAARASLGRGVTIGRWIDASILCSVIEKEILKNDGV